MIYLLHNMLNKIDQTETLAELDTILEQISLEIDDASEIASYPSRTMDSSVTLEDADIFILYYRTQVHDYATIRRVELSISTKEYLSAETVKGFGVIMGYNSHSMNVHLVTWNSHYGTYGTHYVHIFDCWGFKTASNNPE